MGHRRIAIVSDIHGNYDGLMAVLEDAAASLCDTLVCLGDLVDGGFDNEAVVRYVQGNSIPTVLGNHDETNDLDLAPDVRAFLAALPAEIVDGDVLYTHITPRLKKNKINDACEAWNAFDECAARIIFVGHAHIPMIFGAKCPHSASSMDYPVVHNLPFPLNPRDRYIICVGPVGYARDGIHKPRYAIYDESRQTIEMRSVDGPVLRFN